MWFIDRARAEAREEQRKLFDGEIQGLKVSVLGKEIDIRTLREKVAYLEGELKKYKSREVIDIFIADPVPKDVEKRKAYVTAVSGLFYEILHPKLKQMIATVRKELEDQGNVRELDLQLKGAAYALWELIRWGELMVGEDKANMAGHDPSSPTDKK